MSQRSTASRTGGSPSKAGKTGKLPELSSSQSKPMNKEAVLDEINSLRLQVTKMDAEKVRIRSKIARTKQITQNRQAQISQAMEVSDEQDVTIKTASDSTLVQLRKTLNGLKNTLESREAELEDLRKNDRLARSDELQVEVLEYYLEVERLQKQIEATEEAKALIDAESQRLKHQIANGKTFERMIQESRKQIAKLSQRLTAYRSGEQRIETNVLVEKLTESPNKASEERSQIQQEIEELTNTKEALEEEIQVAVENDKNNREFLQKIIDDQIQKITKAIEEQEEASSSKEK